MFRLPEESDIGRTIRRMREDYGFTQQQMSDRVGCKKSTYKYIEAVWERGKKRNLYGRRGEGIKLILARNCFRVFGLELVIVPTSEYRPVYPKNTALDRFWKLTDHQQAVVNMYVAGMSRQAIADKLGCASKLVDDVLRIEKVKAAVNAGKYESLRASIMANANLVVEQFRAIEEVRVAKVKKLAQKRHETAVKPYRKTRAKKKET